MLSVGKKRFTDISVWQLNPKGVTFSLSVGVLLGSTSFYTTGILAEIRILGKEAPREGMRDLRSGRTLKKDWNMCLACQRPRV